DQLLRLLYSDPMVLEYTRPDGHKVQARGEVVDVLDFTRRRDEPMAQVSVAIELTDGCWEDSATVAQEITGTSGTTVEMTEFAGATAPMSDLVITVFGPCNNPEFSHGEYWVKYNGVVNAGHQLQIDVGRWIVGPGTGTLWQPTVANIEQGRPGPWFELDPSVDPFTVTFTHTTGQAATAAISGRRKYLRPEECSCTDLTSSSSRSPARRWCGASWARRTVPSPRPSGLVCRCSSAATACTST